MAGIFAAAVFDAAVFLTVNENFVQADANSIGTGEDFGTTFNGLVFDSSVFQTPPAVLFTLTLSIANNGIPTAGTLFGGVFNDIVFDLTVFEPPLFNAFGNALFTEPGLFPTSIGSDEAFGQPQFQTFTGGVPDPVAFGDGLAPVEIPETTGPLTNLAEQCNTECTN